MLPRTSTDTVEITATPKYLQATSLQIAWKTKLSRWKTWKPFRTRSSVVYLEISNNEDEGDGTLLTSSNPSQNLSVNYSDSTANEISIIMASFRRKWAWCQRWQRLILAATLSLVVSQLNLETSVLPQSCWVTSALASLAFAQQSCIGWHALSRNLFLHGNTGMAILEVN